jgi:hypothetical protein
MSALKQVAHGTIVKIDPDGDSSFTTLELVREFTPPPRQREQIDGRTLDDDFEVPLIGIESKSEFSLEQFWHPGDTNHELLDTAFDAKTEFAMQMVTPHTAPITDEFDVIVVKLDPKALQPNGTYQRTVGFVRTTDITRTTGSSSSSPAP